MSKDHRIDVFLNALPVWQRSLFATLRDWIHEADGTIEETIKFTDRPYFVANGNVCAFLAAKDHINVFIYDPIAADPSGLINQGHGNKTARSIQIREHSTIDKTAFISLIKSIVTNKKAGGWRKIKKANEAASGARP